MDSFLSLNSGIQIDQRILTALEEGKLVIFAGAGVSNVKPSQFSSFKALVEAITVRLGTLPLKKEKFIGEDGSEQYISEEFDRYLGRINDDNYRVHKQAFELLSQKPSGKSSYHKNLIKLFREKHQVRIVTTNFDDLFLDSYTEIFDVVPEEYFAPALPDPKDFSGIVYLELIP